MTSRLALRALVTCGLLGVFAPFAGAQSRNWRDNTGKFSVDASLVETTKDGVVLKKVDGSTVTVPHTRLSDADREYLDTLSGQYPPPEKVKADFLKLLDRPKVPASVKTHSPPRKENGFVIEHLSIASEKLAGGKVERVPMLVVRQESATGRLPIILFLHGTGGTKERMRGRLDELARRGFLTVAIDARYHGERRTDQQSMTEYGNAGVRAWRAKGKEQQTFPWYYDSCWDVWRTIDYLISRSDVDPDRIGISGLSMGGIIAWMAAAVDDRVKVTVPTTAMQSFRWSLDNDQWQVRASTLPSAHEAARVDLKEPELNVRVARAVWNKLLPGALDKFDGPSMLRLYAGRPLLILSSDNDPNCPFGGAQLAFEEARKAFESAGASDKLRIEVANGAGHSVTPAQQQVAIRWYEKWLEPNR